jgi:hypothetical protein
VASGHTSNLSSNGSFYLEAVIRPQLAYDWTTLTSLCAIVGGFDKTIKNTHNLNESYILRNFDPFVFRDVA